MKDCGEKSEARSAVSDGAVRTVASDEWHYHGGKNGAGVWQFLISLMPPHNTYVELFAGSGALLRRKKPATSTIAIDADAAASAKLEKIKMPGLSVRTGDALWHLDLVLMNRHPAIANAATTLFFVDPPYLNATLSGGRQRYRVKFSDDGHAELLAHLDSLKAARVMITGYRSSMYDEALSSPCWHSLDYTSPTRGGARTETVWMNFPPPTELHDYRFVGGNFRERERIKRKISRWANRLLRLPPLERAAIMARLALNDEHRCTSETTVRSAAPKTAMTAATVKNGGV